MNMQALERLEKETGAFFVTRMVYPEFSRGIIIMDVSSCEFDVVEYIVTYLNDRPDTIAANVGRKKGRLYLVWLYEAKVFKNDV